MSVTKNRPTDFHTTNQDVVFRLKWLRIDSLMNLANLDVKGELTGSVAGTDGEIATHEESLTIQDIRDNLSASEKQAARAFIAAMERELAKKIAELENETHDSTDVFVDNP